MSFQIGLVQDRPTPTPSFHCQGQNLYYSFLGDKKVHKVLCCWLLVWEGLWGGDSIALLVLSFLSMSPGSHFLMFLSLDQFLLQRKEQKVREVMSPSRPRYWSVLCLHVSWSLPPLNADDDLVLRNGETLAWTKPRSWPPVVESSLFSWNILDYKMSEK